MKKKILVGLAIGLLMFGLLNVNALAFTTYNGGITTELDWRTDVGSTAFEDFESYSVGTQISELPALGIRFDSLAGGGFPNIYQHGAAVTPYGNKHLGNFPNGFQPIDRWGDIVLHVLPGYEITAMGYWNGDGQSDTLVATVYDFSGNVLGSVGAFKGTFAGFNADVPISHVIFDGNTGDGFNHLDGLQTNVVPIPGAVWLLGTGLIGLVAMRRKFNK
jgi:hypothetical protein